MQDRGEKTLIINNFFHIPLIYNGKMIDTTMENNLFIVLHQPVFHSNRHRDIEMHTDAWMHTEGCVQGAFRGRSEGGRCACAYRCLPSRWPRTFGTQHRRTKRKTSMRNSSGLKVEDIPCQNKRSKLVVTPDKVSLVCGNGVQHPVHVVQVLVLLLPMHLVLVFKRDVDWCIV